MLNLIKLIHNKNYGNKLITLGVLIVFTISALNNFDPINYPYNIYENMIHSLGFIFASLGGISLFYKNYIDNEGKDFIRLVIIIVIVLFSIGFLQAFFSFLKYFLKLF